MHIFFSGIGGVGIGPLAQLALDAGYQVSGSDIAESEMTRSLQKQGVHILTSQEETGISAVNDTMPIDWFVYSSALPQEHPELVYTKRHNIKTSKRADFLNLLITEKNLKLIAVAGTHGKTTTTGMLIWLFKQLSIPVSYSVGTTLSFGPAAQYVDGSEYFVYECDEFDRNFLAFKPEISLITSLDYDHPDTYPTKSDYFDAFSQFAAQSKLCVTWESVTKQLDSESPLFMVAEDNDLSLIKLAGEHNRRNAWLAATTLNRLKVVSDDLGDWHNLLKKVSAFPGTNRRFEKLLNNLYSDYAHHPTEITATIQMAKELNPRVVVIYQPHQNIRQHELLAENAYWNCFDDATSVYWLPTYLSREYQQLETLTPQRLISSAGSNDHIHPALMNDQLWHAIQGHLAKGDLVVGMSAGDLDAWLRHKSIADAPHA